MQRDRWAPGQLAREAAKNVFALQSRLYGVLVFATIVGVAIPLYAAWESVQLREQLAQEAQSGRGVFVLAAADENSPVAIDRASCEALSKDPDVLSSGLLISAGSSDFVQVGTDIPVIEASHTLLPTLDVSGAVVGAALRDTGQRFTLRMPDGTIQSASVGDSQPDVIGTNSAIVVGLPPAIRSGSRCFVKISALASEPAVSSRVIAELQSTGGPVSASYRFSEPRDPVTVFLNRPERFLPLILAIAGAITAGALNRLRTGEWAAYRMSGTSPRSLALIQLIEQFAIAGCLVLATALASAALTPSLIDPAATILTGVASGALWTMIATLIGIDLPFRKPTDLAKDR